MSYTRKLLYCDFCGRSDADSSVVLMIIGPTVAICNHCVCMCVKVTEEWRKDKQKQEVSKVDV